MSVTALVGTIAHFHCAGTGEFLVWRVDGSLHYCQNVVVRGIFAHVVPFPSSFESTLTVPATSENNGITVQCIIQSALLKIHSSCCTLTVLPGKLSRNHTGCVHKMIILIHTVCVTVFMQVLIVFSI